MRDKQLEKELRLFSKNQWTEEGEKRFKEFLGSNKWSINVAGHKFFGKPSDICTSPIGRDEPTMSIKEYDGLVEIAITAPLSQFTRIREEEN